MQILMLKDSIVVHVNILILDIIKQGVLVANKKALIQRGDLLEILHEMLERLEAHLKAVGQFTVLILLYHLQFLL